MSNIKPFQCMMRSSIYPYARLWYTFQFCRLWHADNSEDKQSRRSANSSGRDLDQCGGGGWLHCQLRQSSHRVMRPTLMDVGNPRSTFREAVQLHLTGRSQLQVTCWNGGATACFGVQSTGYDILYISLLSRLSSPLIDFFAFLRAIGQT